MEGASDLQSFVVTVLSTNDAPKIVSVPETTGVQDTGYGYTIEAVDLDPGDVLTCALVSGPGGMTVAALSTGPQKFVTMARIDHLNDHVSRSRPGVRPGPRQR